MDEFIHWPKSYVLLSSTCDAILSWMNEVWTKNHVASDSNCNTVANLGSETLNVMFSVAIVKRICLMTSKLYVYPVHKSTMMHHNLPKKLEIDGSL